MTPTIGNFKALPVYGKATTSAASAGQQCKKTQMGQVSQVQGAPRRGRVEMMTIRERIEAAEKVIASLPDWAKKNLHWDGGDNNPNRAIKEQS